jgi:hypothetical protein
LDLFDEALDETAPRWTRGTMPLDPFWRALKAVLRLKPLRFEDGRRNVVHVLSAHEARQWVLPVVFVCGLVEKSFRKFHRQDPFFPDAARTRLHAAGIRVRTAAEMEREERRLFDSALTRATMLVTLSYPESDARGERNLRSAYLEDCAIEERKSRPCVRGRAGRGALRRRGFARRACWSLSARRPRRCRPLARELPAMSVPVFRKPALASPAGASAPRGAAGFSDAGQHRARSAGAVVRPAPATSRRYSRKSSRAPSRRSRFQRAITPSVCATPCWTTLSPSRAPSAFPPGEFQSRMEEKFEFRAGRFAHYFGQDRPPRCGADGTAYVVDYKYSNAQNTKGRRDNKNLLQAPLYLMAVEKFFGLKAAGMYYIGLKGGVEPAGWEASELEPDWLDQARARTLAIVDEIRAGHMDVAPSDRDKCRFCDCADVCRIEIAQPETAVEGA